MGLRDIVLLGSVYGSVPFSLRKPFFGVLVWIWLSLMNPHGISWTLANAKLAQIAALTMLLSILISRTEERKIPWNLITVLLAWWWLWILITTLFASNPTAAWQQWGVVWKVMLTTFVIVMMLNTKERLIAAAVVMMLSLGFYGFKGGFFTLITGGSHRVWGPANSFISGNNEIGLALIMTLPLIFYVRSIVQSRLVSIALLIGAFLCFVAILGTHSRGALVGIMAMGILLGLRSPNRAQYFMIALVAIPFVFAFMPESWWDRMDSIRDYQSDDSALGRINAWWMAFNLASDNPILGGGMGAFTRYNFMLYAPEPDRVHDAHSIYFEVLGEQGFVGLSIFLALGIATLVQGSKIRKRASKIRDLRWAYDLATMTQLSLIGYAVSGIFLGLAYFDFVYMLVALMVGTALVVDKQLRDDPTLQTNERRSPAIVDPRLSGQLARRDASRQSTPPNAREWSWSLAGLWRFAKSWYQKL